VAVNKTTGSLIAVSFVVTGKRKLATQFERFKIKTGEVLRRAVAATAFEIQRDARKKAPADTGFLRRSIKVYFAMGGLGADVRVEAPYGPMMEWGTGPLGARTVPAAEHVPDWYSHGGSHRMPPTAALSRWATRKGLVPFAVAKSISRRGGLKARPYLGPAARKGEKKFARRIATGR